MQKEAIELAIVKLLSGRSYDHVTAKAHALFIGWVEAFAPVLETHEVLAVESEFSFPLLNPDTEAPSRTFAEGGKMDGLLAHKRSGARLILEHKTTSSGIEPESDYWLRLAMDTQVSKYILAAARLGDGTRSALYDVVRKPAQRPLAIALTDEGGAKIVLDQNGQRVRTKDGKKWRETGDTASGYVLQSREETPEEYHTRILAELESDAGKYFAQREIPRLDSDLLEYMQDSWAASQQILYFRRAKLWPRNPAACTEFGGCEFFSLCAGRASVDGITYRRKEHAHAELGIQTHDGLELLTNSRLRALHKCPRYHFLRYEEPTEPVAPDDEALRLGSAFHLAVETYLKTFIKN